MILNNSENSIRDIRPFCRYLFNHSFVVWYSSSLLQYSEAVVILNYQILLKIAPPQTYWLDPSLLKPNLIDSFSRNSPSVNKQQF